MKSRRSLLLSLVCITVITCAAPVLAQNSQQHVPSEPDAKQAALRTSPAAYRLTYTLTEMNGEKKLGSQHYAMALDRDAYNAFPGTKSTLRTGTKIPIATKQLGENAPSGQFEWSYIDLGLTIDANLRQFNNGLELRTHVIQSALDSQEPNSKDPVVRQTDLETSVLLNEDKPVVLGTLDTPGSTHRLVVQVELTRIH